MNLFGVDLSSSDLWLLGAAGACIAWLVPHRLSLARERRARRLSAASVFRFAVITELKGLYPSPVQWPADAIRIIDVLEGKFSALESAVVEFRCHLPFWSRWLFDRTWRIYRLGEDGREIDGQYYWQYVPHNGEGIANGKRFSHDNRLTYQEDFKRNVDRLLFYAKET